VFWHKIEGRNSFKKVGFGFYCFYIVYIGLASINYSLNFLSNLVDKCIEGVSNSFISPSSFREISLMPESFVRTTWGLFSPLLHYRLHKSSGNYRYGLYLFRFS
tara:strand:+ start:3065 stop:3376 length:312 start_codon:yes stop_codon:yes gene_type:complete